MPKTGRGRRGSILSSHVLFSPSPGCFPPPLAAPAHASLAKGILDGPNLATGMHRQQTARQINHCFQTVSKTIDQSLGRLFAVFARVILSHQPILFGFPSNGLLSAKNALRSLLHGKSLSWQVLAKDPQCR